VYFQVREATNSCCLACPTIVQNAMDMFAKQTGRQYHLFDYFGAAEPSGCSFSWAPAPK
jgi:pyruvate-ferredoxin/flavodoxin oxidoreductase